MPALEEVARALGMALHLFDVREPTVFGPGTGPLEATARLFDVREPTAFANAFAAMTHAQMQALFVLGGGFSSSSLDQIVALAVQHRLPTSCGSRGAAAAGCLMSYGTSSAAQGQLIASYVDRILHGASPADLPVQQPMRFDFVINLKTAQALGLTLPPVVLFQADEIIR